MTLSAQPRRILFTLPDLDRSGIGFSAQNLAAGLLRQGMEVMVLAARGGEREFSFRHLGAKVLTAYGWGLPLIGRSSRQAVLDFRPDVIHAQGVSVAARSARLAGWLSRPLVVTANRLEPEEGQILARLPEAGVIAVSEAIRERLINQSGLDRERVAVIPNCLDLEQFPCRPFDSTGPDRHVPVVGTFGTLTERKGQRVFVQAAARVVLSGTDAEFVIMGQGPDKGRLRAMAADLGLSKRLTFCPGSTVDAGKLGSMDLFVEPSFQEGLGLSVLQAMAAGIPVVASGVGGIYSLVEDGQTGVLVPSGDDKVLAESIKRLLADPRRRLEIARHARDKVESQFSAEKVAARVAEYYARRLTLLRERRVDTGGQPAAEPREKPASKSGK